MAPSTQWSVVQICVLSYLTRRRPDIVADSPWSSQVDAFTAEPFKGNPAAVCLLEDASKAADERWMQSVAAEFNLSETAFLLRDDSSAAGAVPRFQLRWFTPATEVRIRSIRLIVAQFLVIRSSHRRS